MKHLASAAEEAGSRENDRRDRIQHELAAVDVARHAAQVRRVEQETDAGGQAADDEAQGSNGGQIDASPSRRLRIAPNRVDVTPELGSLKQRHPGEIDGQDDRNDPGYASQRAEGGSVDIAD